MDGNGADLDMNTKEPSALLAENLSNTLESKQDDQLFQNAMLQLSQAQPLTDQFRLVDQNGRTIQYDLQSLSSCNTQMMIVTGQSENGQVLHVIPTSQPTVAQVIFPPGQVLNITTRSEPSQESESDGNLHAVEMTGVTGNANSYILHSQAAITQPNKATARVEEDLFPVPIQPLPASAPVWARRLRSCEKIGDSYRGFCATEMELESVLQLHKQQTHSLWGTRQSPSSAKPATRMMWKSQYVPYDGIPFVNAGSRAIVMECQYGPRRKGAQPKKSAKQDRAPEDSKYKATCPARIYIKKVEKFPDYRVPTDTSIDRKVIRMEQEKAFDQLRKNMMDAKGIFRWYIQLPDEKAHQYHELEPPCLPPSPCSFPLPSPEEEEEGVIDENSTLPSRLHPQVADKIRELVIQGMDEVYAVRKQLRKFVERELFTPDEVPERHNLSFFPTVNDIKNHIHQVQGALKNGELVYNGDTAPSTVHWRTDTDNVLRETVTLTFASTSTDGSASDPIITKVESSETGDTLSPETVQLLSSLSSLQPKIFAQLQGLQLQSNFSSSDGTTALITVNQPVPRTSTTVLDQMLSTIGGQSLVFQQEPNVQLNDNEAQNEATAASLESLLATSQNLVMMGQLLTVGEAEESDNVNGEVHQVLFEDGQTLPVRIMDSSQTVVVQQPLSTSSPSQEEMETSQQPLIVQL